MDTYSHYFSALSDAVFCYKNNKGLFQIGKVHTNSSEKLRIHIIIAWPFVYEYTYWTFD